MSKAQFMQLLSLQMVNVKMNMQILSCLLDSDNYNEWKKCFDELETKFNEIMEQLKEQTNDI